MKSEATTFFIMALVGLVGAYIYICSLGGFATTHPPAGGDSIVGGPSISAQKIDAILSSAGSPAAGTGNVFTMDSAQYNIDDAAALAFFHHESGYGLYGAANATHSIGNIVCTDGYSCIGRFRAYPSWQAGIDDWFKLISGPVYVGSGLTTPEAILAKYAPSGDGNNPVAYATAVNADMAAWRQS